MNPKPLTISPELQALRLQALIAAARAFFLAIEAGDARNATVKDTTYAIALMEWAEELCPTELPVP